MMGLVAYLIAYAVGFGAFAIAVNGFRPMWHLPFQKPRAKKSPIKDDLLNYPGKSLMDKIQDETMDAMMYSMFLPFFPVLLLLAFGTVVRQLNPKVAFPVFIGVALLITGVLCWRLHRRFRRIRFYRMGLDGERATGEELNQLMKHGYRIYHDMPGDTFNIDHIVIGPAGVFAVETKYRQKVMGNGKNGAVVRRENGTLRFPTHVDTTSILQARAQAQWLEEMLTKSVGRCVPVQPVVALPGWFIENGPHDGTVLVINPKNPEKFFVRRPNLMDNQLIQQVSHQVEQRCRTIKPFDLN